jgi:hypothetical protein
MNIFANFARKRKSLFTQSAHAQEISSNLPTLTLIPNSPLPNKSSTHRKVMPTKKLTDPEFVYTDSTKTNISKTFQNFKQE